MYSNHISAEEMVANYPERENHLGISACGFKYRVIVD